MPYFVLLGRIFYSAIFILAGINHFTPGAIQYAASQGVPMAIILVPLSGLIALAGGLSILVGYKARYGALLIMIFLIPVTLTMHRFWGLKDPMMIGLQQAMFLKNIALLGSAFLIAYFGSGPLSVSKK